MAGSEIPEVLKSLDGTQITSIQAWENIRRPEVLELLKKHVYGRNPVERPETLRFEQISPDIEMMNGAAIRKRIQIGYSGPGGEGGFALTAFIPKLDGPVPAFLLICNRDPALNIDPDRIEKSPFWPAEEIVARGYAALTFYNGDVDPDSNDGFFNGVHGVFQPDPTIRTSDSWGTIAAWAWGASRVMDWIETEPTINAEQVAVVGHSRGGKTALWCGATDTRFALTISNNSGCGGAKLNRMDLPSSESISTINKNFPHWFCENFKQYGADEDALPVDQHMLVALIAPRLAYVASAEQDLWAGPQGEFRSCELASPVWQQIYNTSGVIGLYPKPDTPLHDGQIGYHLRSGGHNLMLSDWECFMTFADCHWKNYPEVLATSVSTNSIATRGSTLPNGSDQAAVIDSVGVGDDIALPADTTELAAVIQSVNDPATLAVDGKTLVVGELAIAQGGAALTVGATAGAGVVIPMAGTLPALTLPPNPISALAPHIWYDPSDAATVTLDSSDGVTRLANKAATGSMYDAAIPANFIAPLLATGMDSFGPLPMLRSDNASQGLRSIFVTGISGNAPRTLIAVVAHNSGVNIGVSFGASSGNRIFEVVARTENTMFGTYHYDIYNNPAPETGELKLMTFIANSGNPNPLSTFVDGFAGNTGAAYLNTADTSLCLGQRAQQLLSWRGQIGEVILFDYALAATQRSAIESYLLAKWKHGLPASGFPLTLRNDSTAALTLHATPTDPAGGATTLYKEGSGRAVLAGASTHTGATVLNDGALVFDTPSAVTNTLAGNVLGGGTLVKTGPGTLHLTGTASSFFGHTAISGGVVRVWRKVGSDVVIDIAPGAAIDVSSASANDTRIAARINVAGSGTNDTGAIRNDGSTQQMNAFTDASILLTDDTLFSAPAERWDIRNSLLDLNGHVLTKTGSAALCLPEATIFSNAPSGTAVCIQDGLFNLESEGRFLPADASRVIEIGQTATLGLYNLELPLPWTIQAADGATIRNGTANDMLAEVSTLAGPVTLAGVLNLDATYGRSKNLAGEISGVGSLVISNGGSSCCSYLTHSNNTYSGVTEVNNATLVLRYPDSLPDANYSRLSLTNNGGVLGIAGTDAADGFTAEQLRDLIESGRFTLTNNVRAGIDTSLADIAYPFDIVPPFAGRFVKYGNGTFTLDGNADLLGNLYVWGGNFVVTNAVTLNFNERDFYLRPTSQTPSLTNHFGGYARVVSTDSGYANSSQPILTVGQAGSAKAVLNLDGNAFISARLRVGGGTSGDSTAVGAVYQSGNAVWLNTGGRNADGAIGYYGYGYYQLDGGALTNKGFTSLGYYYNGTSSIGILRQNGGVFVMNGGLRPLPAANEVGDSYDGYLKVCASKGAGILHLTGGSFLHHGNLMLAAHSGHSTITDGMGVVTVEGAADAVVNGEVVLGQRHSAAAFLNLNGGQLAANALTRSTGTNTDAIVSFNGGTLAMTATGGMFKGIDETCPLTLFVREGGAVIEIPEGVSSVCNHPLGIPSGKVITAVNLSSSGSGYIAPPFVKLTGGGGVGATAFAEIDRITGEITAVRVTSGGSDYSSAPTVSFTGGGGSGASASTVIATPNADGGLRKTGLGTLCLSTANTYAGPTEVVDGTLVLNVTNAVPAASIIRLENGTLRCAKAFPSPRIWYDPSDSDTVTLDASGNVTRLANKGYTGSAHDAVPGNLAAPHLATGTESHCAYPMVNSVSGTSGLLSLANTGISGTDSRSLIAVISRNNGRGCAVSQCYNISVARSAFEILARADTNTRFGTGATDIDFPGVQTPATPYVCTFVSGVDNIPTQLATFRNGIAGPVETIAINTTDAMLGLNTRNGNKVGTYAGQIGEVMLFDMTLTDTQRTAIESYLIAKWNNGMNVTLEDFIETTADPLFNQIVELDGGTLDLNGQMSSSLTLIGSGGTVSNGTLAAGVTLSPGGDAATGTLSLTDVLLDSGAEYRLSFDDAGADLITCADALDVTGLMVTALSEPSGKGYLILRAEGGLSGVKPVLTGLSTKWYLRLTSNELRLVKAVGTCLTIH